MTRPSTTERVRRGIVRATRFTNRDVAALTDRVDELEAELQEARRLNIRVAELLDIVEELLVPLAQQDQEKVRAYLEAHTTRL